MKKSEHQKQQRKVGFVMKARYIARITFVLLMIISICFNSVFKFLTLNLFLAYIPFELCLLLKLFKPKRNIEWPLFIIFMLVFLFMVPNTLYMVTDLIHLKQFNFNFYQGLEIQEWVYFTFLIISVLLALYLLTIMYLELEHFTHNLLMNKLLILVIMFLNGLGIFIGRFLRLHSVYLINEPLPIIQKVLTSLNFESFSFILLLVILQIIIYAFAKGVRSVNES